MCQYMIARGVPCKHVFLTGEVVCPKESQERISYFNSYDKNIVMWLSATGTHGINLKGASCMIEFGAWLWSPSDKQQVEARCYRIGQEEDVEIVEVLAPRSIQESKQRIFDDKNSMIQAIVFEDFKNLKRINNTDETSEGDTWKIQMSIAHDMAEIDKCGNLLLTGNQKEIESEWKRKKDDFFKDSSNSIDELPEDLRSTPVPLPDPVRSEDVYIPPCAFPKEFYVPPPDVPAEERMYKSKFEIGKQEKANKKKQEQEDLESGIGRDKKFKSDRPHIRKVAFQNAKRFKAQKPDTDDSEPEEDDGDERFPFPRSAHRACQGARASKMRIPNRKKRKKTALRRRNPKRRLPRKRRSSPSRKKKRSEKKRQTMVGT